ncbi:zinc finger C3HC4 type family protein [Musa troglodytarum]|uniref:Zinc finger C3HC4 type family protein n=1 Tax=Musa troglodytarum TaxID=320322 RepID=A0A9E7H0D0_9LILI|nr:zinc finger C3HC4 type family protein [Musa troglodytarum]URE24332.1 zinc finger C3HC4 type family protein [Musa troglodytarum]
MQTSRESSDRNGSEASTSSRYRLRFPPLSATLERLGASLARPSHTDNDSSVRGQLRGRYSGRIDEPTTSASSGDGPSVGMVWPDSRDGRSTGSGSSDGDGDGVGSSSGNDAVATEAALSSSSMPASASSAGSMSTDGEFDDTADNLMNMLLQRSEVQDLARWMERVLPFSLLLSMVFIRQHFQDLLGPIWIAAVMVKSNEIVRAQTALEEGRKLYVLAVITLVFIIHVCGVYYWWYRNDDLLHPLVMISPKGTVAFWRALFIIAVNDTMVRQVAMAAKCMVLMRYTSSGGGDHRMQVMWLCFINSVCRRTNTYGGRLSLSPGEDVDGRRTLPTAVSVLAAISRLVSVLPERGPRKQLVVPHRRPLPRLQVDIGFRESSAGLCCVEGTIEKRRR